MTNTFLAAQMVATVAPWLSGAALLAWCAMLLLLIQPIYRLARRRGRSLDPIWAVLLLAVVNRVVSDFAHVPVDLQHLSAIIIAALLAAVIWSYQHADS